MDTNDTLFSSSSAPPFIYLHHPHHPSSSAVPELPTRCMVAHLDAIEHHTPRLLLSGALNRLDPDGEGEVSTWDGFSRRLREIWTKSRSKGKGEADETDETEGGKERRVILIITKAERLRTVLGRNWAVITRLAELVRPLRSEGVVAETAA